MEVVEKDGEERGRERLALLKGPNFGDASKRESVLEEAMYDLGRYKRIGRQWVREKDLAIDKNQSLCLCWSSAPGF